MRAWRNLTVIAALFLLVQTGPARGDSGAAANVFPAEADPFMGNWVGRWNKEEDVDPDIAANVYPLGGDQYQVILKAKHDIRCPPKLEVVVKPDRGKLSFKRDDWFGEIAGDVFSGGHGPKARFEMHRAELASPTLGLKPEYPDRAIVLFDGNSIDAWKADNPKKPDATWTILPGGILMVKSGTGDLITKQNFGSCRLHVEFRTPLMPAARGQGRGNSGVFLQDVYEVQVLDSYGLEGYYDECGGLYKLAAPLVNACRPPLQWQSYDIVYTAPKVDTSGKVIAFGRMTVHQNGVLIQKDTELTWITAWTEKARLGPPPSVPGPIRLQDHGNYVQYRNIWLEEFAL